MLSLKPSQFLLLTSIFYINRLKEKSWKVNSATKTEKRGTNFTLEQNFTVKFCEWNQEGGGCGLLSFVQMIARNTKDRFGAGVCAAFVIGRCQWSELNLQLFFLLDTSQSDFHAKFGFSCTAVHHSSLTEVAGKRNKIEAGAPGRDSGEQCGLSENAVALGLML